MESLKKDPYNIIITGVGGQGNVMASRVLSNMLVRRGYRITIGETFGMSQRGGAVMSHIRVSAQTQWSPQVPRGKADMVIAIEPIEAIRVLATYGNPQVKVLSNTRAIYPVGVITGELTYPSLEEIKDRVRLLSASAWFLDATDEAVKLGNPILGNIVMIGAVTATGEVPVNREDFQDVIAKTLPPDKLAVNLDAFDMGARKVFERTQIT
ncbi:MAG: indolepyruvate ferredoxin oxidoreductase [Deltaproteobacteria bacterium RBG_13_47_9]|nr:MAG: indolepyruvate ferredoxin oxidoreductase [Deltaproteobacteria bacterium RBG_13_47_9]